MNNHVYEKDQTTTMQPDETKEMVKQLEEPESVSVWEISRRRFQQNRHTSSQARAQGKRRQLRRLSGRNR